MLEALCMACQQAAKFGSRLISICLWRVEDVVVVTWDTGTQRYEGDGRDRVFQTDGAAHLRGQVANDGRQSTDQQYGHDEGNVTVRHVYRISGASCDI